MQERILHAIKREIEMCDITLTLTNQQQNIYALRHKSCVVDLNI